MNEQWTVGIYQRQVTVFPVPNEHRAEVEEQATVMEEGEAGDAYTMEEDEATEEVDAVSSVLYDEDLFLLIAAASRNVLYVDTERRLSQPADFRLRLPAPTSLLQTCRFHRNATRAALLEKGVLTLRMRLWDSCTILSVVEYRLVPHENTWLPPPPPASTNEEEGEEVCDEDGAPDGASSLVRLPSRELPYAWVVRAWSDEISETVCAHLFPCWTLWYISRQAPHTRMNEACVADLPETFNTLAKNCATSSMYDAKIWLQDIGLATNVDELYRYAVQPILSVAQRVHDARNDYLAASERVAFRRLFMRALEGEGCEEDVGMWVKVGVRVGLGAKVKVWARASGRAICKKRL